MKIFNRESIPMIKTAINAYNLRQKIIAENIANATTPGYKRKEVSFEDKIEEVRRKLKETKIVGIKTNPKHFDIPQIDMDITPEVKVDNYEGKINGINNVDIDKEMAKAAENGLRYQAAVQSLIQKYKTINSAIEGR